MIWNSKGSSSLPYKDQEKLKTYKKEYSRKNKDKINDLSKDWQKQNPERVKERNKKWRRVFRKRVIRKLGGKCVNCGCEDFEVLEVNHMNGGGGGEIKALGNNYKFYKMILDGRRTTEDLEVLCKPCNAIHYCEDLKGIEGHWKVQWEPNGGGK